MHTYLCGPIGIETYTGEKNFILFIDDYSRMMTVMYLKEKSEAFEKFKWYLARVEKETRERLKFLRSDRDGEFISNEFNNFSIERGIKRQVSTPGTLEQKGIAKGRNRSIMDCARTLMIEKNVAIKYWKEAINAVVHTLKQVQLNKDSNKTLYELWYGYKPNISYLKESRKGKFDVKGDEGIFIVYSYISKAYKCHIYPLTKS